MYYSSNDVPLVIILYSQKKELVTRVNIQNFQNPEL